MTANTKYLPPKNYAAKNAMFLKRPGSNHSILVKNAMFEPGLYKTFWTTFELLKTLENTRTGTILDLLSSDHW